MKNELIKVVKRTLKEQVKKPGSVLYSKPDTLHKGSFYLLGFNPGGDDNISIEKNLEEWLSKTDNAYLEGKWANCDEGKHPLQKRVKYLFDELEKKLKINLELKEVCASNLIFFSSKDQSQTNYLKDANQCWPVHKYILNIVKPKVIIVFGNGNAKSPYSYLKKFVYKIKEKDILFSSGHGTWKCKTFEINNDSEVKKVIGLPHLSRYKIDAEKHSNVIKWIAEQVKMYVD